MSNYQDCSFKRLQSILTSIYSSENVELSAECAMNVSLSTLFMRWEFMLACWHSFRFSFFLCLALTSIHIARIWLTISYFIHSMFVVPTNSKQTNGCSNNYSSLIPLKLKLKSNFRNKKLLMCCLKIVHALNALVVLFNHKQLIIATDRPQTTAIALLKVITLNGFLFS